MMIKIKLILGLFFLGCILNSKISQALEKEIDSPPPQGYAKVRIWESDIANGTAGHVSVQTPPSNLIQHGAYISLWPNSKGADVRTTNDLNSTILREHNFVLDAPAVGMSNYQQDYILEEKKNADHVYLIKSNTSQIDNEVLDLLQRKFYKIENGLFTMNKIFRMNEIFRWYAPGGDHVYSDSLQKDKVYLNCASAALTTLVIGGLETSYIEKTLGGREALSNLLELVSENFQHQDTAIFKEISQLSLVILPNDVNNILRLKTTDFFRKELSKEIEKGNIHSIGITKDDIFTKKILEVLSTSLKVSLKDETKTITSILEKQGWLSGSYLTLPKDLEDKIKSAQNVRDIGQATVVGVVGAIGIYGLATIAKENKCILM